MGNKGPGPGPVWPISQHFSPRTLSSSTSSIRFRSSQSRPLSLSLSPKHTWLPQEFCSVATFSAASTSSSSESHRSLSLSKHLQTYTYIQGLLLSSIHFSVHFFLSSGKQSGWSIRCPNLRWPVLPGIAGAARRANGLH